MSSPIEYEFVYVAIPACLWQLENTPKDEGQFLVEHEFNISLKPDKENKLVCGEAVLNTYFTDAENNLNVGNIRMVIAVYFYVHGIRLEELKSHESELDNLLKDVASVATGHARAQLLNICQNAGIAPITLPIFKPQP
jgi:hypothetical protein